MKKLAWFVLFLVFLMCYSHVVKHVLNGGEKLGFFTQPFSEFIHFISTAKEVFNQMEEENSKLVFDHQKVNKLDNDAYVFFSRYSPEQSAWVLELKNLRDDSVHFAIVFDEDKYVESSIELSRREIIHPLLLDDYSVVLKSQFTHELFKVDRYGNLVWRNNNSFYHHSIMEGMNRTIWVPAKRDAYVKQFGKWNVFYQDHDIVQLDLDTGEELFRKSVSQTLLDNNLKYIVLGNRNGEKDGGQDPLHLNDIEPVLKTDSFVKEGDLFLSLRNRSCVLHYRPSVDSLIDVISGPFLNQHDVDYLGNGIISIFNNNKSGVGPEPFSRDREGLDSILFMDSLETSGIVQYNLQSKKFSNVLDKSFKHYVIYSHDQGLHEIKENYTLIESQNQRLIYLFYKDSLLYVDNLTSSMDRVEAPHWVRFYTDLKFLNN